MDISEKCGSEGFRQVDKEEFFELQCKILHTQESSNRESAL